MSQPSRDELSRGVLGRTPERQSDLCTGVAELESKKDRLPLILGELSQGLLVPVQGISPDGLLERRRPSIAHVIVHGDALGTPLCAAGVIPDLVEQDRSQVCQERTLAARLEAVQLL